MKKTLSIILAVVLVLSALILSAHAEESKMTQELKDAIKQSSPDDVLNLILWYAYPGCPEPDFQPEDYGEDLKSVQAYLKDYRAYKKAYYTEKNEQCTDFLKKAIEIELIYSSKYTSYVLLKAKADDINKLEAVDFVSSIGLVENETLEEQTELGLYESRYRAILDNEEQRRNYAYQEVYYHYDEDGDNDWALVEADSGRSVPMDISMLINGRVITNNMDAKYFTFKYGVYDVVRDKFFDLDDIKESTDLFPGLTDAIWNLKIGRPLGDADNDDELTVLDATRIQREMAELDTFDEEVEYYHLSVLEAPRRFSDYDGDGGVTILDATAIQRTLVGLDATEAE